MLRWRLISAAVIIAGLVALLWLDYARPLFTTAGLWLLPVLLGVIILGTGEVLDLLRRGGERLADGVVFTGNVLMIVAACGPLWNRFPWWPLFGDKNFGHFGWPLMVLALAIGAVFAAEMQRFRQPGGSIVRVALAVFALVYIGLLGSFVAMLRLLHDNAWGMVALVSMIVITKLADTGAYGFGRTFGRHKMTPILSPGKTWEGAAGGVLTACLGSWAFFHWIGPQIVRTGYVEPPVWAALLYGLVLALAGMLGDLAESLLKRDCARKDSSAWLPGLGGVLDIIDSILFAAPTAYLCWVFGLIGPA